MRKNTNKSQLGSVMIEALAMLALIALVTPVLYKKSAERATELQDINAASELRAIIKSVDDYISTNYETIVAGGTVTNSCGNDTTNTMDYSPFEDDGEGGGNYVNEHISVPLGHFCEFLPYGILQESEGNLVANKSRLFDSDYKVYLKLNGTLDNTVVGEEGETQVIKGQKVVTAFVVTKPNQDMKELRSNSIASMIGGNGGVATSATHIEGNMGIWSIADAATEFGETVTKGAVVAASIEGISAQNSKINLDEVLHRVEKHENPALNAMETTLYMGLQDATISDMNDIVNIAHLIVGAQENGGSQDDRLYINDGNINVGNSVHINRDGTIDADSDISTGGNLIAEANATIGGTLSAAADAFKVEDGGTVSAAGEKFTVDSAGNTSAESYTAGTNAVQIHIDDKSVFNEPLEVEASQGCTFTPGSEGTLEGCALLVKGDLGVTGDIITQGTLNSENLHARKSLTVGGNASTAAEALKVEHTSSNEGGSASYTNSFSFAQDLIKAVETDNGSTHSKTFSVNEATSIYLNTKDENSRLAMNNDAISILAGAETQGGGATANASIDMFADGRMEIIAKEDLGVTALNSAGITLTNAFQAEFQRSSDNASFIDTSLDRFKVELYNKGVNTGALFKIEDLSSGSNIEREMLVKGMDMKLKNGEFLLQKENEGITKNIVRIADEYPEAGTNAQIDISSSGFRMKNKTSTENILYINLNAVPGDNPANYPIYIRKGAIELTASGESNYVQADRFISNKEIEPNAFIGFDDNPISTNNAHYEINPAYTSVMHDIKLTTRGGARLSDILPDFINKGIYIVDNTYPAYKTECMTKNGEIEGKKLVDNNKGYLEMSRTNKQQLHGCLSTGDEASTWSGFVPTPTCPPGYVKVVTVAPSSFQIAETGNMMSDPTHEMAEPTQKRYLPGDLYSNSYPYYVSQSEITDLNNNPAQANPYFFQKNTWLKSYASKSFHEGTGSCGCLKNSDEECPNKCSNTSTSSADFEGWDVGMGFIYPYVTIYAYIDDLQNLGQNLGINYKANLDSSGCNLTANANHESNGECVFWNVFPVKAGTIEAYATVYCYFDRTARVDPNNSGSNYIYNDTLVDVTYDQMESFRGVHQKAVSGDNDGYINRLNDENSGISNIIW